VERRIEGSGSVGNGYDVRYARCPCELLLESGYLGALSETTTPKDSEYRRLLLRSDVRRGYRDERLRIV
jgi:hypothetical protein